MSGSFSPNIAATGSGDVIIQGTNSTSATTDALSLGNMQIQASAGNIGIDGGTQGISFGAGSRAGAGTLVSSSTADVTIRADRLSLKLIRHCGRFEFGVELGFFYLIDPAHGGNAGQWSPSAAPPTHWH